MKAKSKYLKLNEVLFGYVDCFGRLRQIQIDPEKMFLTSDLHLFHKNVVHYSNRPYLNQDGEPDVDLMNKSIIKNWNATVPKDGVVFLLGDIAMGGKSKGKELAEILGSLNASRTARKKAGLSDESRIFVVPGNHDDYIFEFESALNEINILPQLTEIKVPHPEKIGKRKLRLVLCHFPMYSWDRAWAKIESESGESFPSTLHLCGHSHTSKENLDTGTTRLDVGLDGHDMKPWSLGEIWEEMRGRTYQKVDHH